MAKARFAIVLLSELVLRPETLSFQASLKSFDSIFKVQLPRADPIFHQGPPAAPGVVQV